MERILVFLLVLTMQSVCYGKKLKRLENRIAIIEARQDSDSITRREVFSDLSQRLNDVESLLNSSLTGFSVSGLPSEMAEGEANPGAIVSEVDRSQVDDVLRIKSAFANEKARSRRQASDMEHSIQTVQGDIQTVQSDMQSSMKTVKNELASVSQMMTDLKQDLASEMQSFIKTVKNELTSNMSEMKTYLKQEMASVNDVENVKDTLKTLQPIIQDTSIKCTMSSVILDKLSNIEKVLDDHTSPVRSDEQTTSVKLVEKTSPAKPDEQTTSGRTVIPTYYSSCLDLYRNGERVSGAYDIVLAKNSEPIRVYCDMETDGGGWTVFQRRQDGSEDFFRGWDDYAFGFGDVEGEFWLGNDYISQMTSECCHELRIDMEDFEGNEAYAKYGRFKVFPRGDDYKLDVGEYSGNASDSLAVHHSGSRFSTKDRDNDRSSGSCAQGYKGAWWYKSCYDSSLNGLYLDGKSISTQGVNWQNWKSNRSLRKTEMKFRKV